MLQLLEERKTRRGGGVLWERLALEAHRLRVVTLVGAGGKTTLLYALAREAAALGLTVCVTTTTHMMRHLGLPKGRVYQVGQDLPEGKIGLLLPIAECAAEADLVLVEGDGAHELPLKAPGEQEPVIPPESGAVICVAGLSALGEPIERVCHRTAQVCALLGKSPQESVTAADVATILASDRGGRKGVPPGAFYRCALNQAETPLRRQGAAEIIAALEKQHILAAETAFTEGERDGCWF
ncbi:MAG: selenium cofactor biosynthesis protein YqeC [Oscillospiraceae bacterium]